MKKNNYIPLKNYVIAVIVCGLAILLTIYAFGWHKIYKEGKYEKSYLITSKTISLEVNDVEEIENTFTEAPSEYFIFIGYRQDEAEYKVEKKIKTIIDKYNLNDLFYYIDVTSLKEEPNYLDKLNKALHLEKEKIATIPTILYFRDNKLATDGIVTREDENMINAGDFEKLLEKYEFKKGK